MTLRPGVTGWAPRPAAYAYESAYRGGDPNWDIGRPQRAFVALADAGYIRSPVLDVGCGSGELSLYLARQGHDVLGVDFSPAAIERAREKANYRGIPARFLVWDALRLHELTLTFQTVVDSAMFHCLDDPGRERFVSNLAAVLRPGGRYVLFCDARPDSRPVWEGGASRAEIRERFRSPEWVVEWIHDTTFERRHSSNPAYVASVRRADGQA